jgi:hypothetical protein
MPRLLPATERIALAPTTTLNRIRCSGEHRQPSQKSLERTRRTRAHRPSITNCGPPTLQHSFRGGFPAHPQRQWVSAHEAKLRSSSRRELISAVVPLSASSHVHRCRCRRSFLVGIAIFERVRREVDVARDNTARCLVSRLTPRQARFAGCRAGNTALPLVAVARCDQPASWCGAAVSAGTYRISSLCSGRWVSALTASV